MPRLSAYQKKNWANLRLAQRRAGRNRNRNTPLFGRKRKAPKYATVYRKKRKMNGATTTTTKKKVTTITGNSGDITKSYSRLSYPVMKKIAWRSADKDVRRIVFSGGILCNQNVQRALTIFTLSNSATMVDIYNEAAAVNVTQAAASALTNFNSDRKLWCDSQGYDITFTNQGPALIKLHIYDCLCMMDEARSPEAAWDQGLQQAGGQTPGQEFNFHPGSSPTESVIFRKEWRILKKTTIFLPTAANHEHSFYHKYTGLMNIARALELQSRVVVNVGKNMRGITIAPMIVLEGMPGDSVADGTALGQVTLAPAKVIFSARNHYFTRLISLKGKHIGYTNALPIASAVYTQNPDGQGVNEYISNVVNAVLASA